MWTVQQKAQFVLWYAELKSVVAVQCKWRSLHPGEKPPVDKVSNRWMNQLKETGSKLVMIYILKSQNGSRMLRNFLTHNFRFWGLVVSHVEAVEVFSAHCISARMSKDLDFVMNLNSKI